MKLYLTTILLGVAIALITLGIHTHNCLLTCVGGILTGVYNAMVYNQD